MRIPIAGEGAPFIALPLLGALAAAFFSVWWAAALLALLTVFMIQFFRDPDRTGAAPAECVLSPADGTVLTVGDAPPGEAAAELSRKVVVFMSVFNCHVNRSPISGTISRYTYTPGKKLAAFSPKASLDNEQNMIDMAGDGRRVVFKQIAGALARRIVFRKKPGDHCARGERIGMIRFGSRVDVFVPAEAAVAVKPGDKVKAGLSVLARFPEGR
ncbi:MAG TPA: phosphatidylserine decarboxylase family protein [Thermoanaerobaculia bacterium]|nr:phosphatidylserine decarboxylase family protein [Thermoanaerobaculia bacterium]